MHRDLILGKRFLDDRSLELIYDKFFIRRFDERIFSIVKGDIFKLSKLQEYRFFTMCKGMHRDLILGK